MKNRKTEDKIAVDVRIISLGSRDIFVDQNTITERSGNSYYSFSYYDQINVLPVRETGQSAMKFAYSQIAGTSNRNYNSQFIQAFTDIIQEQNDTCHYGYTEKEINDFWENDKYPLFFLTMVNLTGTCEVEKCLEKIKRDLNGSNYITYLTYDHCDIIIFCRENSFTNYARKMHNFAYCGDNRPVGTITLYGFYGSGEDIADDGEEFHALIRMGAEYIDTKAFCDEIGKLGKNVEKRWFLERKDIGIYCPNATVKWLFNVRKQAKKILNLGDITYDLLISVGDCSHDLPEKKIPKVKYGDLQKKLNDKYEAFSNIYNDSLEEIGLTPDSVWLRWLKNSSDLAVAFIENYLSMDLGTCLIPQFLDLFDYGIKFFDTLKNGDLDANVNKRNAVESLSMSFSKFFSYVAILIDSMNQSDRQFLQIPSFHLPSFEVPPKIMEYYVAVAHKLKDLFHEDINHVYGLLITPQFINKLGVQSIADQRVLKDDQWLEIVISESSFYTLQLTTQVLGHEISHFVGQENRCREYRKKCALQCAYFFLIYMVSDDILNEVNDENNMGLNFVAESIDLSVTSIKQNAELLYNKVRSMFNDYDLKKENYLINLENLIYSLVDRILNNPSIYTLFFEVFYEYARSDRKKNETTDQYGSSSGEDGNPKKVNIVDFLLLLQKAQFNIDSDFSVVKKDPLLNNLVKDMLDTIVRATLSRYRIEYHDGDIEIRSFSNSRFEEFRELYKQALDYFKETFADLQAIMVFRMNWIQYCGMIKREEEQQPVADAPLRMLAVAKVLAEKGFWKAEEITGSTNELFIDVEKALRLDIEREADEIQDIGFNAALLFYLCDYLGECYEKIKKGFTKNHSKETLADLREMHDVLSCKGILETQKKIGEFVDKFRRGITGNPT